MNTIMNIFMRRICLNLVKTCHLLQHLKLKLPYQQSKLFWKPHQDFLSHLIQPQTVSTFKLLKLLKLSSTNFKDKIRAASEYRAYKLLTKDVLDQFLFVEQGTTEGSEGYQIDPK